MTGLSAVSPSVRLDTIAGRLASHGVTGPNIETSCYRHADRPTNLSCSNCGRAICPECSHDAAVGQRCPECLATDGSQQVVQVGRRSRPAFRDAPVTYGIIAVAVAIEAVNMVAPAVWEGVFFENAAMFGPLVSAGEWWRLVTVVLVHAGFVHVGFNMLLTYQLGVQLEKSVGSGAYATLFLACAAVGSLFAMTLGPDVPSVGASGAVFGLVGTWLAPAIRGRSTSWGRGVLNQLGFLLLINAVVPFVLPSVSWQAHLGGLLAGLAIGWLWGTVPAQNRTEGNRIVIAGAFLVGSVVIALLV